MSPLTLFTRPTKIAWSVTGIVMIGSLAFLSSAHATIVPISPFPLTPNLVALPAQDVRLEVIHETVLLRFSTLSWNNGTGPVEIYGGEIIGNTAQKVYQNVHYTDGSINSMPVGDFVYHPAHNHIHFEGYATYKLEPINMPDTAARNGQKTSFCLMDTSRVNTKLSGASKKPVYTTCSGAVQGISVGWGDKYGYQLAGQEIDVTGLPDGDYKLIITVNPYERLIESSYGDNVSEVVVRLAGGTASVVGGDTGGRGRP